MSYQEEALGQIQDLLERLYVSVSLGTTQFRPGRARGGGWEEGGLENPLDPDKWQKMDGWMKKSK